MCQVRFSRWLTTGSGRCSGSYHLSTSSSKCSTVLQSSWEKVKVQKGVLNCLRLLQNTRIKTIVCWTVRSFRLCKLGTRRSASIVKPFMLPGTKRHAARAVRPRYRIGSCNSRGTGHNIRKQLSVLTSSGFNSLLCTVLEHIQLRNEPSTVLASKIRSQRKCGTLCCFDALAWNLRHLHQYPAISLQLPVDLSEIILHISLTFHCSDKLKGQWSAKTYSKKFRTFEFQVFRGMQTGIWPVWPLSCRARCSSTTLSCWLGHFYTLPSQTSSTLVPNCRLFEWTGN